MKIFRDNYWKRQENMINTTPQIHLIHFDPVLHWSTRRPLPNKIPALGPHGGVVKLDKVERKRIYLNPSVTNSDSLHHQTIHIGGIGHGAGTIVISAPGPILVGTVSLGSNVGPGLWIIVAILLFISAMIWAATHLVCSARRENRCMLISRRRERKYWIGNVDSENGSQSRTLDQLFTLKRKLEEQDEKNNLSLSTQSQGQYKQSDTSQTFEWSTQRNMTNAGLTPSSNSIWSSERSSTEYLGSLYSHLKGSQILNQITICKELGLIFTISEWKCPNAYLWKDGTKTRHCEQSIFEECAEIFLLCENKWLVGKMRNLRHEGNEEHYAIQIWEAGDGLLLKSVPYGSAKPYVSCNAVCSIKDKYLVLIRQGEISVWNMTSNLIVSNSVLGKTCITRGQFSIEPTKCGSYVVIKAYQAHNNTIHIYSYSFDQFLYGCPTFVYRSFTTQKYSCSSVMNGSMAIVSADAKIMVWTFSDDVETLVTKYPDEHIHKILISSSGYLALLQFDNRLSIWRGLQSNKLSDISLPYYKACAISFEESGAPECLVAVALEDGSIQLHNSSNGNVEKVLQTNLPIVYMIFHSDDLIVMADRASHYQLFRFDIRNI